MSEFPEFSEKLNLGCGKKHLPGFINIDIKQPADLILNLGIDEFPYFDGTIKLVTCEGLLEQIKNLTFLMNEVHRVLEPNGIFQGYVPNARCQTAFQDPETKRFFNKETFTYFQLNESHYNKYGKEYGYLPWKIETLKETDNGLLYFRLQKPFPHEIK